MLKQKHPKKYLVFGDILHYNFSISYILSNMKSSSCTQPFTEYICSVSKHSLKNFSLCALPKFKIVVLRKMTLKCKNGIYVIDV